MIGGLMRIASLFVIFIALAGPAVYAQRPPAIPGVTGTIATKTTIEAEHKLAHKIAVATERGIDRVFPAGKGPLSDLQPGTSVAIYFDSTVTEATVADVSATEVTLRYANGNRETLRLVDDEIRNADSARQHVPADMTRVVVYNSSETQRRIARYFRLKNER